FGNVTVVEAPDGGSDTLDFTSNTGTISHPTDTTFVSSTGGTVTITGTAPEQIDLRLADPGGFKNGIKNALGKAAQAVEKAGATTPQLSTALPLLDPGPGTSISGLLGLGDSFGQLASQLYAALASSSSSSVSDVVKELKALVPNLPQLLSGLAFSSAYAASHGDLLAYITASMDKLDPATCTAGPGCARTSVALDGAPGGGIQLTPSAASSASAPPPSLAGR